MVCTKKIDKFAMTAIKHVDEMLSYLRFTYNSQANIFFISTKTYDVNSQQSTYCKTNAVENNHSFCITKFLYLDQLMAASIRYASFLQFYYLSNSTPVLIKRVSCFKELQSNNAPKTLTNC